MTTLKSATERTIVTVSVGEKGEVDFAVSRGGSVVNTFSLPREQGIGASDTIVTDAKAHTVTIMGNDGINGPVVKEVISL